MVRLENSTHPTWLMFALDDDTRLLQMTVSSRLATPDITSRSIGSLSRVKGHWQKFGQCGRRLFIRLPAEPDADSLSLTWTDEFEK